MEETERGGKFFQRPSRPSETTIRAAQDVIRRGEAAHKKDLFRFFRRIIHFFVVFNTFRSLSFAFRSLFG